MRFDLGKILFPKDHPLQREIKMAKLFFGFVGAVLLVLVVVLIFLFQEGRFKVPLKPPLP